MAEETKKVELGVVDGAIGVGSALVTGGLTASYFSGLSQQFTEAGNVGAAVGVAVGGVLAIVFSTVATFGLTAFGSAGLQYNMRARQEDKKRAQQERIAERIRTYGRFVTVGTPSPSVERPHTAGVPPRLTNEPRNPGDSLN